MDEDNNANYQPFNPFGNQPNSMGSAPNPGMNSNMNSGPNTGPNSNYNSGAGFGSDPNSSPTQNYPSDQGFNAPYDGYNNNVYPASPVATGQGDVVLQSGGGPAKKENKVAFLGLVGLALVLIFGATFFLSNFNRVQPEQIIVSSIDNLLNSKQVNIEGDISLSSLDSQTGIESINVKLNRNSAQTNRSTNASIELKLVNNPRTISLGLGETIIEDGTIYIKADGLKTAYYDNFRDIASLMIKSSIESQYRNILESKCGGNPDAPSMLECSNLYGNNFSTNIQQAIDDLTSSSVALLGEIIDSIDGKWIEISINEVLNSEIASSMDSMSKRGISSAYDCIVSNMNKIPDHTSELTDLYTKNQFIIMQSGQDSFYNISLNPDNLTGFLNGLAQTQLVKDFGSCYGVSSQESTPEISSEDVKTMVENLPQISAKFEKSSSYYLSELKLDQSQDAYTLSSDLKFSYSDEQNVSAPDDSKSFLEALSSVYQKIQYLQESIGAALLNI